MTPFFSIIVPCCEVAPYVRECLDSVIGQSFTAWECLIGVETSTDATEEIVRSYAGGTGAAIPNFHGTAQRRLLHLAQPRRRDGQGGICHLPGRR